jgi:predicted ATP-dependent endonuclease of OLD family
MKLLDLQLHNFRKLSNLPQPTIAFNQDINVLVGANNAGKTSVLKAIQKLFGTEAIDVNRDANYLLSSEVLYIQGFVKLTSDEWKDFLQIALTKLPQQQIITGYFQTDTGYSAERLIDLPILLRRSSTFVGRKLSNQNVIAGVTSNGQEILRSLHIEESKIPLQKALDELSISDLYNIYKTPLYLDSKGKILDREPFVALNQIENQSNNEQVNIRGLLYSLKKKEPAKFADFKQRLLEIFTELEDIDAIHNEDLGEFQLVIHEKLRNNGDTKSVSYDINNVGQGMQTLVIMLSTILLLKPSIVLMDEPEVHMHPSLIKDFVGYIKKLSVDTQFIMTTHSEVLINEVGLDKVFYLENDIEQKGIIVTKVDDKNKLLEAVNSLGYSIDSSAYTIKPSVFVFTEGSTDKDFILAFAKKAKLEKQINSFNTAFIAMGGKGNRYKFAALIDKLNEDFIDSPLLMILDKDETSNSSIKDIENKYFSANQQRLHYLDKRQIENYLLDEHAIKHVVAARLKDKSLLERWNNENILAKFIEFAELQKEKISTNYLSELFINESLVNTKSLSEILKLLKDKPLNESVPEFTGELFKLVGMRTAELGHKTTSARVEFENKWNTTNKVEMADGREILKSLRRFISDEYKVSFSADELIEAMAAIPAEIMSLLNKLTKPDELRLKSE